MSVIADMGTSKSDWCGPGDGSRCHYMQIWSVPRNHSPKNLLNQGHCWSSCPSELASFEGCLLGTEIGDGCDGGSELSELVHLLNYGLDIFYELRSPT